MQEWVYQKPVQDIDDLKQRLIAAWSGTWAPAPGGQGGQAPTLEKIRVGMAHPGNFSRGLKLPGNSLSMKV